MENSKKTSGKDIISKLVKPKEKKQSVSFADCSRFSLTPKGILLGTLDEVYGTGASLEKLDEFSEKLIGRLSAMATAGESSSILGKDFNDFFQLYVETINLCGRMKEALEENGINFDIYGEEGPES